MTNYFIPNYQNPMNDIKVNLGEDQPLYQYIKKAIQDIEVLNILPMYKVDENAVAPFIHVMNWKWNPHPTSDQIQYRRRETGLKVLTKYIGNSRIGIADFDIYCGARDKNKMLETKVIHNQIYIPIADEQGKYLIDNVKYTEYQLVDKLLYPCKDGYTLKSLLPVIITYKEETEVSIDGEKVRIGGITKGVGMIAPNMGTMLCFLATDAVISSEMINKALKSAVNRSFNMIVVDGDQSTNDTAILMANGKSGVEVAKDGEINEDFQEALDFICISLAKMMARDGEGATKFIECKVNGAKDENDAILASKSVISSSLVKSAIFGGDPNWGRIVAAVGYSGCEMNQDMISVSVNSDDGQEAILVDKGKILAFEGTDELNSAEEIMQEKTVNIVVDLYQGDASATAWGCDLTYNYVKINAEYTT